MPGQFGPMRRDLVVFEIFLHGDHVANRNAFRNANDQLNSRIGSFADRIGRAGRGNEDHRRVRAGLWYRFIHGVPNFETFDFLSRHDLGSRRPRRSFRNRGNPSRGRDLESR